MAHERLSQYAGQGRFEESGMQGVYGRAQTVVEEHPGYSALACFTIGLGVGAALTVLLMPEKQTEKAWYEDYLPDEDFTEDLAEQVRAAVRRILPDALARYLNRR